MRQVMCHITHHSKTGGWGVRNSMQLRTYKTWHTKSETRYVAPQKSITRGLALPTLHPPPKATLCLLHSVHTQFFLSTCVCASLLSEWWSKEVADLVRTPMRSCMTYETAASSASCKITYTHAARTLSWFSVDTFSGGGGGGGGCHYYMLLPCTV